MADHVIAPAAVDWRQLFIKYTNVVGNNEGVDFLYPRDWTPEEWQAIRLAMQTIGVSVDR